MTDSSTLYALCESSSMSFVSGDRCMSFVACVPFSGLICFKGRSVNDEVGGCLRLVVPVGAPFCSMSALYMVEKRLPMIGRGERRCDVKSGRGVNADGVDRKKDRLQAARKTRPGSMPMGGATVPECGDDPGFPWLRKSGSHVWRMYVRGT
jgi:hypothetical protein